MTENRNSERVMIAIPPAMREAMERIAEEEDRSLSSIVRLALNMWFAERNGTKS